MLLHCIWEVATSNLSSDTEHFDLGNCDFSGFHRGVVKIWVNVISLAFTEVWSKFGRL